MEFRILRLEKDKFMGRTYSIYENESVIYNAIISWGNRVIRLKTPDGTISYEVRRSFSIPSMKFELFKDGAPYGYAKKDLKLIGSSVRVNTSEADYLIKGSFNSREFTIEKKGIEIAKISRQIGFLRSKKYGLAVSDTENVGLMLAFTLIIELMIKVKRGRRG